MATESGTPLEALLQQDQVLVSAGLAGVSALAWLYMFYEPLGMRCAEMGRQMAMPVMDAWGGGELVLLFAMWAVMMVAMMVPSAAPMMLMFAAINRTRRAQERPFVPTSVFLLGYLAAWTGFSALATVAQWALHATALLSPAMVLTSPVLGGALLLTAGIFQFTPFKRACLVHCRTPLGFLMTEWREGMCGAFLMGLRHGLYCVGCCWFLMMLLFVAGVMNLLWVAVISAFVLVEKIAPAGQWVSRSAGVLLIASGLRLLLASG